MSVQPHDDAGSSLSWDCLTDAEIFNLFAQMVSHCSRTASKLADWGLVTSARSPAAAEVGL